jgi:hypothetical protein
LFCRPKVKVDSFRCIELPVSSDDSEELPKLCTKERKSIMSVKIEDVVKEKPQAKADTIVIEDYDSDPKIPIYSTRAVTLKLELSGIIFFTSPFSISTRNFFLG